MQAAGVQRGRLGAAGLVAMLLFGAAAGCGPDDPERVEPESPSSTGPDLSDAELWLDFEGSTVGDDGELTFPDALGGSFEGRAVTANGGTVEEVPGPSGEGDTAVAFPAKCTEPSGCPRAMVEVLPAPTLNPGGASFEYGATVWLSGDQTTTGSNIVQKGRFGTEGGLWKLQVDKDTGEPSCVIRSGAVTLSVRSSTSIADATWHRVACQRGDEGLSIRVDDSEDSVSGRTGSVSNDSPVRVGSPGVDDQDDQFHGRIDDVFLRIGPA